MALSVSDDTLKSELPKSELIVALVEPRIPQNVGNIARLCVCAGAELYLVGSLGFRQNDKFLKRAGMDYLGQIHVHHVSDLKDLLALKPDWSVYFLSTKASNNYSAVRFPEKSILVFGSETKGLPEWLIEQYPDNSLRIPMMPEARSLTLSNSVAIVLFEALRQQGFSGLAQTPSASTPEMDEIWLEEALL